MPTPPQVHSSKSKDGFLVAKLVLDGPLMPFMSSSSKIRQPLMIGFRGFRVEVDATPEHPMTYYLQYNGSRSDNYSIMSDRGVTFHPDVRMGYKVERRFPAKPICVSSTKNQSLVPEMQPMNYAYQEYGDENRVMTKDKVVKMPSKDDVTFIIERPLADVEGCHRTIYSLKYDNILLVAGMVLPPFTAVKPSSAIYYDRQLKAAVRRQAAYLETEELDQALFDETLEQDSLSVKKSRSSHTPEAEETKEDPAETAQAAGLPQLPEPCPFPVAVQLEVPQAQLPEDFLMGLASSIA